VQKPLTSSRLPPLDEVNLLRGVIDWSEPFEDEFLFLFLLSTELVVMDLHGLAMSTCPNSNRVDGRHTIESLTLSIEVLHCFSHLLGSECSFQCLPACSMALGSLV
jgi:hypothetical protein